MCEFKTDLKREREREKERERREERKKGRKGQREIQNSSLYMGLDDDVKHTTHIIFCFSCVYGTYCLSKIPFQQFLEVLNSVWLIKGP